MPSSQPPAPSPLVRFPTFSDLGDLNSLSIVIQDLSAVYDVTAVAVLPGYERVPMPATRLGPRRRSPLRAEDRLQVRGVSLGSPLEIVFCVTYLSVAATALASRVAHAAKAWIDVLAAGVDLNQRRQALELNRALAPEQLNEVQLRNALLEQDLRRVTEPDLVSAAREEFRGFIDELDRDAESSVGRPYRSTASQMTSGDFADLLQEPMERILGYGGGQLEVAGHEDHGDGEFETS